MGAAVLFQSGTRLIGGERASILSAFEPITGVIIGIAFSIITLMFLGAVVLAPVTEELLFRGLIFRGLYDRSPLAAHLVSMGLFSLIHVSGYVGMYDAKLLFFCFLQYLAPAYCLNFAYRQSGSIISPILMHMATNLVAFLAMR